MKMSIKDSDNQTALETVLQTLKIHLPDLQKNQGVKSLGIFGSYAKGSSNRSSDLDLLVEFKIVPTMFEFVRLERRLSTILGVKVDLVMKTALKPEIGKRILAEVAPVRYQGG